jgi:pimeloyl-ACP methyl ester carboxylesterase
MASRSGAADAAPAADRPKLAVDEGAFVPINGLDQWITIRGHDMSNPVLLFVHGGPGMGSSITAPAFAEWEKHFTFVQWDQPGGGFTQMKAPAAQGEMTVARYTRDGIAVAQHVLERTGKKQLVLMGNSWGTLIGLEMVKARPELFSAYVGSSQAIGDAGNKLGYKLALEAARGRNDATAVAALERVGPPPYDKFEDFFTRQQYSNPPALPASAAEQANLAEFYGHLATPPAPDATYIAIRENMPDQMAVWNNFVEVQKALFRETWSWEARKLGLEYRVPVFVYQGDMDINTPVQTAREWLNDVKAPKKGFDLIKDAGHNTIVFQKELLRLVNRDVRPLVAVAPTMANR